MRIDELRTTPQNMQSLLMWEVFVFESNLDGNHVVSGASHLAEVKFGAKSGIGFGMSGQSFAIPSVGLDFSKMTIEEMRPYVESFISTAREITNITWLVAEIGCGIAGYTPEEIAPLFREAVDIDNIYLPKRFWEVLKRDQ